MEAINSQCVLYNSLGVDPDCSAEELTAAFRKLALKYHPDKNPGQEEKFREVSRAYKILSDYESRKIYDVAGEEALRSRYEGGDPFSNAHYSWADVEGLFRHHVMRRRGQDLREDLEVTLEDLCCGAYKNVTLMKYILCPQCKVNIHDCYDCNGSGRIGGFGCDSCQNQGYVDANEDKSCALCKGERVVSRMTTYKINIRPGMYGGQYIPFVSEGNEVPGSDPGDRVFILKAKEHLTFERVNMQDLATEVVITSRQKHQPGGSVVKIKTLDGRILDIPLNQGIRNGTVVEVMGEGLPDYFVPTKKGKLIITVRKVKNPSVPTTTTPTKTHDARVKRSNSLGKYFFPSKSSKNEAKPSDWEPASTLRNENPTDWSPSTGSPSRQPKVKRTNSFGPFGVLQMRTRTASGRTRDQVYRKSFPPLLPSSWTSDAAQPQKESGPCTSQHQQYSIPTHHPGPSSSLAPPATESFSPPPQLFVQTSPLAEGVKPELVFPPEPEIISQVRKAFGPTSQEKSEPIHPSESAQPEVTVSSRIEVKSQTYTQVPPLPQELHTEIQPDDSSSVTTLPEIPLSLPLSSESSVPMTNTPDQPEVVLLNPDHQHDPVPSDFCPIDFSENDTNNSIDSHDYEFTSVNDRATIRAEDKSLANKGTPIKKRNSFKLSFRKKKTPPRPVSDNKVVLDNRRESKSNSTPKKRISHGPLTSFFLFRK